MSSEIRQERWFGDKAEGVFPPVSNTLDNGRKKSADLALVRASLEDDRFLSLNPAERRILQARFFPEDGLPSTFGQLAQELGLGSVSSARRAQEHILKKLQKAPR